MKIFKKNKIYDNKIIIQLFYNFLYINIENNINYNNYHQGFRTYLLVRGKNISKCNYYTKVHQLKVLDCNIFFIPQQFKKKTSLYQFL